MSFQRHWVSLLRKVPNLELSCNVAGNVSLKHRQTQSIKHFRWGRWYFKILWGSWFIKAYTFWYFETSVPNLWRHVGSITAVIDSFLPKEEIRWISFSVFCSKRVLQTLVIIIVDEDEKAQIQSNVMQREPAQPRNTGKSIQLDPLNGKLSPYRSILGQKRKSLYHWVKFFVNIPGFFCPLCYDFVFLLGVCCLSSPIQVGWEKGIEKYFWL